MLKYQEISATLDSTHDPTFKHLPVTATPSSAWLFVHCRHYLLFLFRLCNRRRLIAALPAASAVVHRLAWGGGGGDPREPGTLLAHTEMVFELLITKQIFLFEIEGG